jgi:regulator of protease activity HflC (stomatin/prohibitin superfamily)
MSFIKKDSYDSFAGFTRQAYVIFAAILAVILLFMFCFRTVEAGQVGIITRFGEVDRTANSGIALKLPWPIEKLNKMDIRVQKEEQDAPAATSDLQDVTARLALNYALDNATALRVYKEIGNDYKNRIVVPALQESFKAASSQSTAAELLTKRAEVKARAYDVIKSRLEKYGIRVIDLNITNFSFSQEFTKAIEAKQVAQQQAEQAQFNLQRAELDAKAQEAQKTSLSPELLQKYAIDKWDGKMPQYVGGGAVFNIPLNK